MRAEADNIDMARGGGTRPVSPMHALQLNVILFCHHIPSQRHSVIFACLPGPLITTAGTRSLSRMLDMIFFFRLSFLSRPVLCTRSLKGVSESQRGGQPYRHHARLRVQLNDCVIDYCGCEDEREGERVCTFYITSGCECALVLMQVLRVLNTNNSEKEESAWSQLSPIHSSIVCCIDSAGNSPLQRGPEGAI